jgi:hypothetical protein
MIFLLFRFAFFYEGILRSALRSFTMQNQTGEELFLDGGEKYFFKSGNKRRGEHPPRISADNADQERWHCYENVSRELPEAAWLLLRVPGSFDCAATYAPASLRMTDEGCIYVHNRKKATAGAAVLQGFGR